MKKGAKYSIAALVMAVVLVLPSISSAQTVAGLQAQIQALLAQVQALQAQLTQLQGGTTTWCHTFNTNLGVGASGPEVTALQTALQKEGFSVAISGNYDEQTAAAVTGFQEKYKDEILTPNNLQYGTGYVGPSTRAKLNTLYGYGVVQPTAGAWFSASPTTVNGIGDVTFSWSTPASSAIRNFTISCVSGVITYVRQAPAGDFRCGDVSRPVDPAGSYIVSFNNTSGSSVTMTAWLDYGTGQPLTTTVTIIGQASATTQPSVQFSLTPTYVTRNQSYAFNGNISNAAPNSVVYFSLQRPDGSFYLSQYTGEAQGLYKTDSGGVATIVWGPILIKNEGENGQWLAWVTITGKDSNKVPITVVGSNPTQPSITVLSPNGGETLIAGQTYKITWNSSGVSNVMLELCFPTSNGGSVCSPLSGIPSAGLSASQGSYSWYIDPNAPYVPGNSFKIWVSSTATGTHGEPIASGTSNAPFSIVAASTSNPSITLLAPKGGETLTNGQQYTISWTTQNLPLSSLITVVLLHQTTNSKINQFVNIPNSGSVAWTIKTTEAFDNTYQILVEANCDANGVNCAAAYASPPFSIVAATITNLPDLQITDISPVSAVVNQFTTYTAVVKNNSSQDVNTPFAVNLGGIATTIPSLAAWQTATVSASFGLSILGPNQVCARVDIWNTVVESNELNNDLCKTVNVVAVSTAQPDLTITNFYASPSSVVANQKTRLTFTVSNIGNAPAQYDEYTYTSQADGFSYYVGPADGSTCLGVAGLSAGASCQVAVDFTFPTAGSKLIQVLIDPNNKVTESNKANNSASLVVNVVAATSTQPSVQKDAGLLSPVYVTAGDRYARDIASFDVSVQHDTQLQSVTLLFDLNSGGTNLGLSNVYGIINDGQNSTNFNTISQNIADGNSADLTLPGQYTIRAGRMATVSVFANVAQTSANGSYNSPVSIVGIKGVDLSTGQAVSWSGLVQGQNVSVSGGSSAVQPGAITVTTDSSNPAGMIYTMGSTGVLLAAFRFTETSNIEGVKVTDLQVLDSVISTATVKPSFGNLSLYQGSTLIGVFGAASTVASPTGGFYVYFFHFSSPIVVPQANTVSLALKGDVMSYASSGATDNSVHAFQVNNVQAVGASSNAVAKVTLSSPNGNPQTVLRTKLTVTAAGIGPTTLRAKSALFDNFSNITFSANSAGPAALNKLTVTFSGTAPNNANFLNAVDLIDPNTGNSVTVSGATASVSAQCNGSNTCAKTWNFSGSGWPITAGASYTFTLRINDMNTWVASSGVSATLSASIQNPSDVTYTDGLDPAAVSGITLLTYAVPVQINAVSFTQGTYNYTPSTISAANQLTLEQMANLLQSMTATLQNILKSLPQ